MGNPAPGKVSDVAQAVHAAEINKKPIISNIGNRSFHDHAFFKGGAHVFTHFFPFLFKDCPS